MSSAIPASVPRSGMYYHFVLLLLLNSTSASGSQLYPCEPTPEIRAELQKAAAVPVSDPAAFDQNVAQFLALRKRYPDNLFVHERYQDAVLEHGIEGHLQALVEEYQALDLNHSGDLMYHYLFLRSLVGRGTPSAILGLNEMITVNPSFAPAHRTLAELYGVEAFRDQEKEIVEREKSLALCPTSAITQRPDPLPAASPLIGRAERLLAENGVPDQIIAMINQGLNDDEWRNQRIRAFDWYSVDYKRENLRQLRDTYWKAWRIEVRCERKAGRPEKAAELMALLERRAAALRKEPGVAYWNALDTLVQLYAEGKQMEQATQKLEQMQQLLAENPEPGRTATLERLRKLVSGADR